MTERDARQARHLAMFQALGPIPPWWRLMARASWSRRRKAICEVVGREIAIAATEQIQAAYQQAFANLMEQVMKAFVTVKLDRTTRDKREVN